jgi:hypothetical protein
MSELDRLTMHEPFTNLDILNLVEFAEKNLVDKNGEYRHELNNEGLSNIFIYHDLGDIVPFLLELGEYEILNRIMESLKARLNTETYLISRSKTLNRFQGLVKSYDYTDFLIGLEDLNRKRPETKANGLLKEYIQQTISIFRLDKKHSSYFYPKLKFRFPIVDSRDTTFIEIFCDLSESLNDEYYKDLAFEIFLRFKKIREKDILSLLPDFKMNYLIQKITKSKKQYSLMKNHTNTLHAYLRLYEITQNKEVLDEINEIFLNCCSRFSISKGKFSDSPSTDSSKASLKASFALIEFICDFYILVKNESVLSIGLEIANFWISIIGPTGLFPMDSDSNMSFIDSQTDMVISLWRLAGHTGDKTIMNVADRAYHALCEYHGRQGYPLNVDIKTGEIIDKTVRTKFVFLYIKAVIAYDKRCKNISLLNSQPELRRLLRDR